MICIRLPNTDPDTPDNFREVRRLQELRRIIQEECDHLLLKKERLKEEVGQSLSLWCKNTWSLGSDPEPGAQEGQALTDNQPTFQTWSLDMLNGIDELSVLDDHRMEDRACASTNHEAEKARATNHWAEKALATNHAAEKALAADHGTARVINGQGAGFGLEKAATGFGLVEGCCDAWTQVPSCDDLEIQSDTLASIATAYKVVVSLFYIYKLKYVPLLMYIICMVLQR